MSLYRTEPKRKLSIQIGFCTFLIQVASSGTSRISKSRMTPTEFPSTSSDFAITAVEIHRMNIGLIGALALIRCWQLVQERRRTSLVRLARSLRGERK